MISKDKKEELKKSFEEEDKLRQKIQNSLAQTYEEGKNAPDFLEEARKNASKNKKVARPESDSSV